MINYNRAIAIIFFLSLFSLLFIFPNGASAEQYYCPSQGVYHNSLADCLGSGCSNGWCAPVGNVTTFNGYITYRNGTCNNINSATGSCSCPAGTGPELLAPWFGCSNGFNEPCFAFRCDSNSNGSYVDSRYCNAPNTLTGGCSCPAGSAGVVTGNGFYCSNPPNYEYCTYYDCQPHQTPGPTPTNGNCWGVGNHNTSYYTDPPFYLCDAGNPTSPAVGFSSWWDEDAWLWVCQGLDGGTNVACDAGYTAPFIPPITPTINFFPGSQDINLGNSATLNWSTINAQNGCVASLVSPASGGGSWSGSVGTSGPKSVTPTSGGIFNYTLTCTSSTNTNSSAVVTVRVNDGCAANTCIGGSCWNGYATVSGTKVCVGNGCAANTCIGSTCWNNLDWVNGTKVCVGNGCETSTCIGDTCWNNLAWVNGTQVCNVDNGCAANTCIGSTCWNSYQWVNGTKVCNVDNGCAANTCIGTQCNNSFAWVDGTLPCDNGCAADTCIGSTCDNSINPFTPGTKAPVYSYACESTTTASCDLATCGQTITTSVNECFQTPTNGCGSYLLVAESNCPDNRCDDDQETCKACPVKSGDWKEVAPQ